MLQYKGANVYTINFKRDYVIHYCAANGHLREVELPMSRKIFEDIGNMRLATPMMNAPYNGWLNKVHYLHDQGVQMKCEVNIHDESELTWASEKILLISIYLSFIILILGLIRC